MTMKTKKYQEGGGIREGRARFGDDVRERARRAMESQGMSDEEAAKLMDREPKAKAKAIPVKPAPKIAPKPLAQKPDFKSMVSMDEDAPMPIRSSVKPSIPRDEKGRVDYGMSQGSSQEAKDRAAKAREQMWSKPGPLGSIMDAIKGAGRDLKSAYSIMSEHSKKKGGAVKMAKGGSVGSASKRADGCAQRGKTKGRMI